MMMQLHEWGNPGGWLTDCAAMQAELRGRLVALLANGDEIFDLDDGRMVVVCQGIADKAEASRVAHRFSQEIARPEANTRVVPLMVSMGVVHASGVHTTADDILADAETALKRAAEAPGTQTEIFDEALRIELMTRFHSLDQINGRPGHDLSLGFQPIVATTDRSLHGIEALLRWDHKGASRARPQDLINLAERTNSISQLGRWVMEHAVQQIVTWRDLLGSIPTTYINVSGHQLLDGGLLPDVRHILDDSGLGPNHLGIEVTESTMLAEDSIAVVRRLRDMGISVALDDFGTGFSGLKSLARLPLDKIKLDMSFVHRLDNPTVLSISSAIVSLAHDLGMAVVAEGIESDAQLKAVSRIGCDEVQGYLIARPMPGEALASWAKDHRTKSHRASRLDPCDRRR